MMDFKRLEQLLLDSIEDERLDAAEKRQLRFAAADFSQAERGFIRNRAFDLVRQGLEAEPELAQKYMTWLQQVIKTIRPADSGLNLPSRAYFSPGHECRDALIDLCQRAKQSIDVCVFTITDNRLSAALLAAHKRDVAVRIISDDDKSGDLGSDVHELKAQGLAVKLDTSPFHMHHKFALFDQRVLVNGSFNWTRSASDKNQENIMLLSDAGLIAQCAEKFEQLWASY